MPGATLGEGHRKLPALIHSAEPTSESAKSGRPKHRSRYTILKARKELKIPREPYELEGKETVLGDNEARVTDYRQLLD